VATRSHWQADLRDAPDALVATSAERYDVAVVGGGIAGVSTAYWLHRLEPGLRVVVLEGEHLAAGASGRNAGFLLQGADPDYATTVDRLGRDVARRLWELTMETRQGLVEALGGEDVGLEEHGSFVLAGDEAEDERLQRSEVLLREDGISVFYLPPAAAEALGCRGMKGALVVPTGAVLHPVRTVHALADRSGAAIRERCPVLGVATTGDNVELRTSQGAVRAEKAVLALNAFLPRLLPDFEALVRPVRAQMLVTAPVTRRLHVPVYSHVGYFYLRQLPTGEVLLGGARHLHADAERGYDDATTPVLQADLESYLHEHFPSLAGGEVVRRWSGTMGFSPDGLPAIGRLPGEAHVWGVAGFTGHGMAYGFRTARAVAAAVLGLPDEYSDLLSVSRLSRGPHASADSSGPA
jgi:gamma-glutamylputrescine oxidase